MNAILTTVLSDLRRRKLQTLVIAFVMLLSSGAATLALNLLVESDAPYEHAFARANGPHLTLTTSPGRVTETQLRGTASARGVTATAGPWPKVVTTIVTSGKLGAAGPQQALAATIVGRETPETSVDRLTLESGRWARSGGEVVLARHAADSLGVGVGDTLTMGDVAGRPALTVVGVAASIDPSTDAWVLPTELHALVNARSPLQYQMLYRVHPAATSADLRRATQAIASRLPSGSVQTTGTYLDVKRGADLLSSVMVPFLLAFSAFALLAAVLIISNVVSGIVIAGYRDIGIMKSVGFAPGQVTRVLLAQIMIPTAAGCLLGIPLGMAGSQPFLQQTAHALNLPAPFTAALPVDLFVLAAVAGIAALAAIVPAWRAGHLSAVTAITMGMAPSAGRASRPGQVSSRLPLPRSVSLGLSDALARPLRSITTTGAILIGVATVVFALSLHLSLGQVAAHLIRDRYVQIEVRRPVDGPQRSIKKSGLSLEPPPAPAISDQQVITALRSNAGTARFVAEAQDQVSVPGIAEPVSYYAYRGASSWVGYALISGRWFTRPGEVVAPTRLLQQAHLRVGAAFTARVHGRPVRLHLVGEILDQTDADLLLRGGWMPLEAANPHVQPSTYEVQVRPGVNPQAYANILMQSSGTPGPDGLDVWTVASSTADTDFILLNGVIAGLALILTAIAVAGVFNTVLLSTREKVRDVAVLKALGMAPAQVVAMVVASVAVLGLVAGALGIPIGLLLHRQIIQFMGQAASGTGIPPAFFDLINHALLPLLALAGVAIAALGAWLPARWAASSGVTEVLQTE